MKTSWLIGYKAGSEVVARLCSFAIVLLGVRLLSASDFGIFSLAWACGWMVAIAADLGMQTFLTREVARDPGGTRGLFESLLRVRLTWAGLLFLLVGAAAWLSGWPSKTVPFLLVIASQLAASVLDFYNHLFRGLGRSDLDSTLNLAHRLGALLLSALLLIFFESLVALAAGLAVAAAGSGAVAAWLARSLLEQSRKPHPRSRLTLELGRRALREVLPIGLGILLSAVYFRLDLFFLERWLGLEAVAEYNAVFRLVDALRLFPAAVMAVIFPEMSRDAGGKTALLSSVGLLLLSVLLMAALSWQAGRLVLLLYGSDYISATPSFRILLLSLPLLFVNFALTHQMIGWNMERQFALLCGAGLIAALGLNWLLIPALGMAGAAWSCLVREAFLNALAVFLLVWKSGRRNREIRHRGAQP